MALSRGLPADRLAIGQLLVRLLHQFRAHLMQRAEDGEFLDVRPAHLQIWGNLGVKGIRLTDLADRANLSLPACSELVDQLEDLGYLERRPDPSDGRAKLIFPTPRGRRLLDEAGRAVADLESAWGEALGPGRFEDACATLNHLLALLGDTEAADLEAVSPPAEPDDTSGVAEAEPRAAGDEPEPPTRRVAVFTPGPRPGVFRVGR